MPSTTPKSVSFSECSSLYLLTKDHEDDTDSVWYTPQERKHFRLALLRDARKMSKYLQNAQAEMSPEQLCECIGIEHWLSTPDVPRRMAETRRSHASDVLLEQQRQERFGVYDVERLASVSMRKTSQSKERASRLAVGYSKVLF